VHEGKHDEALKLLREAVDHGLSRANSLGIGNDPDFESLHGNPGFEALVKYAKERAAAQEAK